MKKRVVAILLTAVMGMTMMAGCSSQEESSSTGEAASETADSESETASA